MWVHGKETASDRKSDLAWPWPCAQCTALPPRSPVLKLGAPLKQWVVYISGLSFESGCDYLNICDENDILVLGVVGHAFNPSTEGGVEAGGSLCVQGQPTE